MEKVINYKKYIIYYIKIWTDLFLYYFYIDYLIIQ